MTLDSLLRSGDYYIRVHQGGMSITAWLVHEHFDVVMLEAVASDLMSALASLSSMVEINGKGTDWSRAVESITPLRSSEDIDTGTLQSVSYGEVQDGGS